MGQNPVFEAVTGTTDARPGATGQPIESDPITSLTRFPAGHLGEILAPLTIRPGGQRRKPFEQGPMYA